MSIERKITQSLYGLILELEAHGQVRFLAGDLCDRLRQRNQPLGAWQVRRLLTTLEAEGLVACDPDTCEWRRIGSEAAFAPSRTPDAA